MTKLAKGLTLVAGGVPAAAILTACVINASPNVDAETLHAENVAAETDTAAPKKPPHTAAPYAMVQPRSMTPPGAAPAKEHRHKGGGHRTQTVPDPKVEPGAVVPSVPVTPQVPATAPVPDDGPAYVPTGPGAGTPPPAAGAPPPAVPPVSTGHPAPIPPTTTDPALGGQTASPPRSQDPAPTHPAPHEKRPDPARQTDKDSPARGGKPADQESSPMRDGRSADPVRDRKPADEAPTRRAQAPRTTHSTPEPTGRTKPDEATTSPDRVSPDKRHETAPDTNANEASGSHLTVAGVKQKLGKEVVAFAKAQLGKPYVFGAEGPRAYDCSGLVQAAYKSAGINVPRTSDVQYWFGKRVHAGQERPGDLVFFDYKPGHSGPGHVGIVLDPAKGLMVVAPHTGDHVKIQSYKRYPGGPAGFTRPLDRPDMQHRLARMAK